MPSGRMSPAGGLQEAEQQAVSYIKVLLLTVNFDLNPEKSRTVDTL